MKTYSVTIDGTTFDVVRDSDGKFIIPDHFRGIGTSLKPAFEPIVLARKPLSEKTVAANVLRWRTGALNIDACRVGSEGGTARSHQEAYGPEGRGDQGGGQNWRTGHDVVELGKGRWPANILTDGSAEVIEAFPVTTSGGGNKANRKPLARESQVMATKDTGQIWAPDVGSAARFFYSSKASKADRADSKHPTVKPISLMEWLCKMITPPGGTILDPFAGTGTTAAAAFRAGFHSILVEREEEYQSDIRRRMGKITKEEKISSPTLFDEAITEEKECL